MGAAHSKEAHGYVPLKVFDTAREEEEITFHPSSSPAKSRWAHLKLVISVGTVLIAISLFVVVLLDQQPSNSAAPTPYDSYSSESSNHSANEIQVLGINNFTLLLPSDPLHPYFWLPSPRPIPSLHPLPNPPVRLENPNTCFSHILRHQAPTNCPPHTPIDTVITWVNGSSPLWQESYADTISKTPGFRGRPLSVPSRHYSNLGEMKYAMRSVQQNLVGDGWGRTRVVSADFPIDTELASLLREEIPGVTDRDLARLRRGQVPSWLNWSVILRPDKPDLVVTYDDENKSSANMAKRSRQEHITQVKRERLAEKEVAWAFHSEIFLGDDEWRAKALPNFNSFAIESQIPFIPFLSATFVSMNDDFFLLRPMVQSDFATSLFGPVLRFQNDLGVDPKEPPAGLTKGDSGEWGALQRAAVLIQARHPGPRLEYLTHLPKTLNRPLIHELSLCFPSMRLSASRQFREEAEPVPDIEVAFLYSHYVRRRWREALLWSFVVARPGTESWGSKQREELSRLGVDGWSGVVGGSLGLDNGKLRAMMESAGIETPQATEYVFASVSGLPETPFIQGSPQRRLSLSNCLGSWWDDKNSEVSSEEIFRRLAFHDWQCGDLLLSAILSKSPGTGLSMLLPSPGTYYSPTIPQPNLHLNRSILPLTSRWEDASFSLASIFPTGETAMDLLSWCENLLARYRYVMGKTPSHFTSLKGSNSVIELRRHLDSNKDIALLAVNDDLGANFGGRESLGRDLRSWGEERWGTKGGWEV